MAIKRENKFKDTVARLDEREAVSDRKSNEALGEILGKSGKTKTIVDKNGVRKEVKIPESRKTLPVYIPESLYETFDEITTKFCVSKNATICQLIRIYVIENKDVLNDDL